MFLFLHTKFQKWIWSVCQGNNSATEACWELPAQIFQEAEGLSNREAAVAHGHVGYTLWWDKANQVRGEKVFSKQTARRSVTWMPLWSKGHHFLPHREHKWASLLCPYYMLSSWPLMVPLSGKQASALLMVLTCCFLSWSSRLCSKSVEADRGSPSLTRTTKANRIRDMIHWVYEKTRKDEIISTTMLGLQQHDFLCLFFVTNTKKFGPKYVRK